MIRPARGAGRESRSSSNFRSNTSSVKPSAASRSPKRGATRRMTSGKTCIRWFIRDWMRGSSVCNTAKKKPEGKVLSRAIMAWALTARGSRPHAPSRRSVRPSSRSEPVAAKADQAQAESWDAVPVCGVAIRRRDTPLAGSLSPGTPTLRCGAVPHRTEAVLLAGSTRALHRSGMPDATTLARGCGKVRLHASFSRTFHSSRFIPPLLDIPRFFLSCHCCAKALAYADERAYSVGFSQKP